MPPRVWGYDSQTGMVKLKWNWKNENRSWLNNCLQHRRGHPGKRNRFGVRPTHPLALSRSI